VCNLVLFSPAYSSIHCAIGMILFVLGLQAGSLRMDNHFLFGFGGDLTLFVSHANPSSNPSPVVAQLGTTNQILSLSWESLSASVTSCGFIAPGISCLFANTSNNESFISRSLMIRCNSCLASSIRTLSEESITKIRPCVPLK